MKMSNIKKITIYNAGGRIIKTLDIPQNSENTDILKWNGSDVPSGVYFIELQSIYGKYCTSFLML